MQKHKRLSLTLLILFLFTGLSAAKERFILGRVFTVSNDTITGWIDPKNNEELSTGCNFKIALNTAPRFYGVEELKGFELLDDTRLFLKKTTMFRNKTREVFLEVVVAGKLELLSWEDAIAGNVMYLARKGENELIDLPFEQKEILFDNGYTRKKKIVTSTMHQDTLSKYMADRPDLLGTILSITKPGLSQLTPLLLAYNNQNLNKVAPNGRATPVKPFLVYIMPGVANSDYKPLGTQSFDRYAGGTLSFRLLGNREQLLLTAGIYKRLVEGNPVYREYRAMTRIPLNLDLCFRGKWVKPFFGIGANGFFDRLGSNWYLAPSAGLKLRIINNASLVYRYTNNLDLNELNFFNVWIRSPQYTNAHALGLEFHF